jgi:hypothetical protein
MMAAPSCRAEHKIINLFMPSRLEAAPTSAEDSAGAASSRDRNKMNNDNMKEKDKCGQETIY